MTHVAIQPSYGNAVARRHWKDTLDQEVSFGTSPHADALTEDQLEWLLRVHPSGRARFWGATSAQDRNMSLLGAGDVVLFTGQNHVRGVGEVGATFRNADFADTMWSKDPTKGSWLNVYSLLAFQPILIPYKEIWDLPSFNTGDSFMGLRVLRGDRADEVLDGLGIRTSTESRRKIERDIEVARLISEGAKVVEVEGVHTERTAYRRSEREIVVHRAEALLVTEYRETLSGLDVRRLRTPSGITDLHVAGKDGCEVIEAKSDSGHGHVRLALGQLLDYAPHSPERVERLSALFPGRPADADVALLHRYGIDVLYRVALHQFERLEASGDARNHMRQAWSR
ncbi:hypothetical protein ACIQJ4_26355 [Streptomyces filamentosus]|uniref:hypothetical protein n=1 Tax=Streptomyces filamentosus TaxID=67294 RepID=UPI00380E7010